MSADPRDATIQELPKCDVELRAIGWAENGRDLSVHLKLPGTDYGSVHLLCEWAEALHIALTYKVGCGGPPLSWDMDIDRADDGSWSVFMDFASTGSVSFRCSEITVVTPAK